MKPSARHRGGGAHIASPASGRAMRDVLRDGAFDQLHVLAGDSGTRQPVLAGQSSRGARRPPGRRRRRRRRRRSSRLTIVVLPAPLSPDNRGGAADGDGEAYPARAGLAAPGWCRSPPRTARPRAARRRAALPAGRLAVPTSSSIPSTERISGLSWARWIRWPSSSRMCGCSR